MISIFALPVERPQTKAGFIVAAAASWVLVICGILLLAYSAYIKADAGAYQAIEARRFKLSKPALQARIPSNGDVIGEIQIPRLDLKAIVVQGDSFNILRRAVGHISETALPGEPGNVALAAHRDTFFRPLRQIRPGDLVTFDTPGRRYRYQVESTRVVSSREIGVLHPSSAGRELTLITCFPFDYIGSAPNRFIVRAKEVGPSFPREPARTDNP